MSLVAAQPTGAIASSRVTATTTLRTTAVTARVVRTWSVPKAADLREAPPVYGDATVMRNSSDGRRPRLEIPHVLGPGNSWYVRAVLFSLATPADNARGPQYLVAALAALQRSFRGGAPVELIVGQYAEQVGLYARASKKLTPLLKGQLQAAYPDLRLERLENDAFTPKADEIRVWARLRLVPATATLIASEPLLDRQEQQWIDPLASLMTALASRKGESLRPWVSLLIRPAGRLAKWRMRRRKAARRIEPVWSVDVRLVVICSPGGVQTANAKIHELAGLMQSVVEAGQGGCKLSRIRQGSLPQRVSLFRQWLVSPRELAILWHPPTASVQTPQLRTNDSRELEPPPPDQLPTLARHPQLATLGRNRLS